jgi:hypothetical protein
VDGKSGPEKDVLIHFSDWVRDQCRITINVKLYVVCDLIHNGEYLNIYDAAAQYSDSHGVPEEDLLKAWLGSFYERRIAFDSAFEHGKKFNYGALTAGSGGLREYDPYCLQLVEGFHATVTALAYFPGDSISICFTAAGDLDEPLTCSMITSHTQRHILATCKHCSAALSQVESRWPELMSTKAGCIEAVFVGKVTLNSIEKVQVLKSEYDRVMSLIMRTIGRRLETAEHTLTYSFRQVVAAAKNKVITLEHVI